MTSSSKKVIKFIVLIAGVVGLFSIFMFSCETESAVVNLALKQNGKTYLFSKMGSFIVEESIKKQESPSAFPFIQIFEDDGLFVSPQNAEDIANVLGGNFKIHPYPEASYDGYITVERNSLFTIDLKNKSTVKIGEQIQEYTVQLLNPHNQEVHEIQWEWNPKAGHFKAIKNCEVKSFWITTSIQPGETVTSSEDFIMVSLADLVAFYGGYSLEFDQEGQLLYLIQN